MNWVVTIKVADDPDLKPLTEHEVGKAIRDALINVPLRLNWRIKSVKEAAK